MGWPGLLSSWYSAETWKVMCISRGRVSKQKKQRSFIDDGRSMVSVLSGMDSFKPPAKEHWGFPPFTMMKTLKWTSLSIYLRVLSILSLNKCYWVPLCHCCTRHQGPNSEESRHSIFQHRAHSIWPYGFLCLSSVFNYF